MDEKAFRPENVPWDQQPGESDEDYSRFKVFLADESKTSKDVAKVLDLSASYVSNIAWKNRWRPRREAFYIYERAETRRAMRDKMVAKHEAMLEGWELFQQWSRDSVLHHLNAGTKMSPRDAVAGMRASTEAIRLIMGQTTSNVGLDLSKASAEDLAALDALLKKIEGEEGG